MQISRKRNAHLIKMTYGIGRFFLLSWCLVCCWPGIDASSDMRIVREWAQLDFVFPNESARLRAIEKRYYVPSNAVPIDVDVHYRKGGLAPRMFITVQRIKEGTPITLGTVDEQGQISAYPDYSWHDNQGQNCDGLTAVFRVAIDECNRLWVMDTGKIGDHQYCAPQLLAFDLDTDQLIYRHRVNQSSYIGTSRFVVPVVDVRSECPGDCKNTFVYVGDETGFGLLVVDTARDLSWRVTHRLFYPYPSRATFNFDGGSFDSIDGVLSMALSPYKRGEDRYLYFHALASTTENVVPTSYLRNDSFIDNPAADPKAIKVFPEERPNQSAAEAMDRNGVLYFGLMDPPSIWSWNSATEFSPRNFHQVAVDKETLQFSSGVKIVNNLDGEQELWVLTCGFQRLVTGTLSSDQINVRIHTTKITNSTCEGPTED